MSSEDLYKALLRNGSKGPIYRRRKRHQGASWVPESGEGALAEDGPWCASCRQRHGFMSKTLVVQYEQRNGVWYILWVCKKSGDVIRDQALLSRGKPK